MPRKKTLEAASPIAAAPPVLDELPRTPVSHRPAVVVEGKIGHKPLPSHDSLAAVSAALGATLWTTGKRFEWARAANRHHYDFTRFYFQKNVLVDVFPAASPSVRKEAEQRGACIAAESARSGKPMGYLPIVKGALVRDEHFQRALAGEVLPLVERTPDGVLV